jgi:class 3 adenylate cyclase
MTDAGGFTAPVGEIRRLTLMSCDLVGSTELSVRVEPEAYRAVLRQFRDACHAVIESRFDGHIITWKGDGAMASFGFPVAHEDDAERAVRAGLALLEAVRALSEATTAEIGEALAIRIGIHHGDVITDRDEHDVWGVGANVASRVETLADPGTLVVSDEVRRLVEDRFEVEPGDPRRVKGLEDPLPFFRVVGERSPSDRRPWSAPLVERETELERLRQAWKQVREDGAAGVLVHGDAGVGKSRLVAAIAEEIRAAHANVVWLYGSTFHADAGFHPVRGLVERRCGIRDDTSPSERLECLKRDLTDLGFDPSETIPLLAPVLRIEPGAGYREAEAEGRLLEEQIAEAVRRYIVACTRPQPSAIVAENLHWFDVATRELLAGLARTRAEAVLVIATSREPKPASWDRVDLGPLTFSGRLALIDALDAALSEDDRLALAARSGGVPLYVEELVRSGGVASGARTDDVPVPGSIPAALYEPLAARLYAAPGALPVAAAAAAAGHAVERDLLAAAIPDVDVDAALDVLVDAEILERADARGSRYQFRHELLREVAYEIKPPSWRRILHGRLGDILRGDAGESGDCDWHVLASHFMHAERPSDEAEAYQNTAEWARRRGAIDEARDHLSRAIELVMPLAGDAERDHREVQLRLRRAFLATSAEGAGSLEAAADFTRCVELAGADPRSDDAFSTLISLWTYHLSRAELDRAHAVGLTLRDAVDAGRESFWPQNVAGFGILDWFGGQFTSALATLTAATNRLTDASDDDTITAAWFVPNDPSVAMHVHLALARFMAADATGAEASLARAHTRAAALDFPQGPWSAAYAAWLGSWMWIEADRFDRAENELADLQAAIVRHGFDAWEILAATQADALDGVRALRAPAADAAALSRHADDLAERIAMWEGLELRVFLPFYLTTAGALLAAAGDRDGAREQYDESLRLADETGMRFYDAETLRRRALLADDADGRATGLRNAAELARSQAARPFAARIAADLDSAATRATTAR